MCVYILQRACKRLNWSSLKHNTPNSDTFERVFFIYICRYRYRARETRWIPKRFANIHNSDRNSIQPFGIGIGIAIASGNKE